jgi:hypothetical protein
MKISFSLLLLLGLIAVFSLAKPAAKAANNLRTQTTSANSILNQPSLSSNSKQVIQNPNAASMNNLDVNLLDALAHRFLFRSDSARRQYIASLAADDRLFQVAYGCKRRGLYDLIRQYFHPSVAQIVLYGSNSFYIQVGRTFPGGQRDAISDWHLSSLRYQDFDRRDGASTYVNAHVPMWINKQWKLIPTISSYGGMAFYITFANEQYIGYDGVNQKGWSLSAVRRLTSDKRDATSTFVSLHAAPIQSNTWTLTPVLGGDSYIISLARDDLRLDGVDQTSWCLDVADVRKNPTDAEDQGLYIKVAQGPPSHSWVIRFAQ